MGLRVVIEHNGNKFEPPVKEGVQIEWELMGSPGKLTFTTIKVSMTDMSFVEGDPVYVYYDEKLIFVGFVFTKRRDKQNHIEVTCYDQLRYLKNKFTYVFENKTATQIIQAMCNDFGLKMGILSDTSYVIPAIAEENISAFDIILEVLEETLLNTGNMYILRDNCGSLEIVNCEDMKSNTLIMSDTAENYEYKSSIDDETYNQVVLYYKQDGDIVQIYTATSPELIKQWGMLRYFEEVKNHTIGQNKANSLLKLYNKKTRELTIEGAFGDISIRGGSLIPVNLNLGDVITNNYMLVEKVVHTFNNDHHTMDLTLQSNFEDSEPRIVSKTIGEIPQKIAESVNLGGTGGVTSETVEETKEAKEWVQTKVTIDFNSGTEYAQYVTVDYEYGGVRKQQYVPVAQQSYTFSCDVNTKFKVYINALPGERKHGWKYYPWVGKWMLHSFGFCSVIAKENPRLVINFQKPFYCDWYGATTSAVPSYNKVWKMDYDKIG